MQEQAETFACQNCEWTGPKEDMNPIPEQGIFDRVDVGEPMPAGECPKCGALCHPAAQLIHLHYEQGSPMEIAMRHPVVPIMAAQWMGWFNDWKGTNYVETELEHPEFGRFVLTMQRKPPYKTPAQKTQELLAAAWKAIEAINKPRNEGVMEARGILAAAINQAEGRAV